MKKIFRLLDQPFPIQFILNNRFKFVGGFSIFISAFLFFYQPFGVHHIPKEDRALVIMGYGAVCFLIFGLDTIYVPFIFSRHFKEDNWKMYKQILLTLYTIGTVTTGAIFYNHVIGLLPFNLHNSLMMLLRSVAVGIIPAIIATVLVYNLELQKNLNEARKMQAAIQKQHKIPLSSLELGKIVLMDAFEKELLTIKPEHMILIRSADNYIEIFWKDGNKTQRKLLRQTMKYVEEHLLKHPRFFRCHRTSIVNLMLVKNVSGNSLGCKLQMEGFDEEVPVSRNSRQELYKLLVPETTAA